MAKLNKNEANNIDYFIINLQELTEYNSLDKSVCDECLRELTNDDKIILIPILNEAYDYECGMKKVNWLKNIENDAVDKEIQKRRTKFYIDFFKSINSLEGYKMPECEERKILEFIKNKDGISVNIEDKTEILDVLIGIGLALDMLIKQQNVSKNEVLKDVNEILTVLENEDKKGKGEKKDGSK